MPVYFGDDAEFAINNNAIQLTSNSNTGIRFNSSGLYDNSNKPMFIAQGNGAAWINFTAATWNVLVIDNVLLNAGQHYSTSTGRFTAPVSGIYYFCAQTYTQRITNEEYSRYTHPLFRVNGSFTARQVSQTTPYRLRNRTYYDGTYVADTGISEVFFLNAGDYIEKVIY